MAIPLSQLTIWAGQGSVTQSSTTYNTIKSALETPGAGYSNKMFNVFLQGSYGNDTNTYTDSDVDTVIQLEDTFSYNIDELTEAQKASFRTVYPSRASYPESTFKQDVLSLLTQKYGNSVTVGNKSIKIAANSSRRNADVVAAISHRRYYQINGVVNYYEGISFTSNDGTFIVNYPKMHSANCTAKHQATNMRFKPVVRIFKNLRSKLIDDGMLEKGDAPSYFIEGLIYNVPNSNFTGGYSDIIVSCVNWLFATDRTHFVCANERYYLLRDGFPVTWRASKCDKFLNAVRDLWNNW